MTDKLHKSVFWAVLLSEGSHIFCCILPTLFSVFSLLAGLGVVATMPTFMVSIHDTLHHWELPMIAISGLLLALGWGLTIYSDKIDCHDTGCCHGACAPQKSRGHLVLKIATVLFIFNIVIYLGLHRTHWVQDHFFPHAQDAQHSHE